MPSGDLRRVDQLADRIRLHRQVDGRPAVVVEGPRDRSFVHRLMGEKVAVFTAGSREEVIRAAEGMRKLSLGQVGCVLDRDFDDVVIAAEENGLPLATYDDADLEAMLWWSPALDAVVEEIGSKEKLSAFGGISTLRDTCVEVIRPLQRLRRANALNGWGLPFDKLELRRRINQKTLSLRTQSLCDALWDSDLNVNKSALYEAAAGFPEAHCPATGRPLVRGRDAIAAVGVALRHLVGNISYANAEAERIAEIVRLRASEHDVQVTQWRTRLHGLVGV